jgi:ATP-dependent protease ClpP protease subunit
MKEKKGVKHLFGNHKKMFWKIDSVKEFKNKTKTKQKSKKPLKKKNKKRSIIRNVENEIDDGSDASNELKLPNLDFDMKEESIYKDGNHIYFYSEVSRDSCFKLNLLLKEAEEENLMGSIKYDIDMIPIYLHINSFGGSVYAALSTIDVIKASKVPVITICEGAIASAGTLISVVGAKRYMRPSAYLLIHQLSSSFWGKMSEIEDEYINLKSLMKKIKKIYKEHCKIPKKELNEILKHDLWWDYEKCLEMGLVDGLYPIHKSFDEDAESE